MRPSVPRRARNDLRQYDDLADQWWDPQGAFCSLHWLAEARGRLIPPAPASGGQLLDVGCGGGLLAPHVHGYHHVGVDLSPTALAVAAEHGVEGVEADVAALPFADSSFDVVVAGEILEHVTDLPGTVADALRVLKPGGAFICDTINSTRLARLVLVTIGEHVRGGPPPACHDPELFVNPRELQRLCAAGNVQLSVHGLRPASLQFLAFQLHRRQSVDMVRSRSLAAVYQGFGTKALVTS
ncbi:MAG TPA: bifunctional 2-polyprenyl-6-hydroxyphenol methylase/3-demethylubiquinol 3-O-methyltransferase UbiG [Solirubrobacteraceae bacterium]|nr:bifunctional 2-polyprenyl-6-hydroxyphenol methylase/3-demethylubiquinol 3-O-methyltransferase UbiG [Solirubrobacteraceae bacterium]